MASRSLGTLTIDLVARTGGFVAGMSKAERESKKWRRQVERDLKKVGADLQRTAKIAAGVVAAGGAAITAMTKKGLDAVSAQATLARSLDTTFDSVTALQLAFSDAGIDNFEASINRLNRRLGAAELGRGAALQAVKELNLNLQELASVEADERLAIIADRIQEVSDNSQVAARYAQDLGFEQREAAQFFVQGGDAIRAYRKEVDEFGLALSAIDAAKVELATAEFQRTGRIFTAINQQLAVQVAPLLGSISSLFLDTAREAGSMGDAIESVFDRAVIAGINTASSVRAVFNQFKRSVEDVWSGFRSLPPWAQEVGIAGALIGGKKGILVVAALSKAAEDTKVTAAWFSAMTQGEVGFYEWLTSGNAEAKERLKELGHDIDEIKAKSEGPSIIDSLFGPREDGDEWAEDMIARYRRMQDEARKAAEEALESQRKLDRAGASGGVLVDSEGIEKEISALERAAKTWGMSADEVKLYGLEVQGATDAQIEYARGLLETVRGLEAAQEEQAAYLALVNDLRTDEERLSDQFHDRIAVLDAVAASARIAGDEYARLASRAAEAAFSAAPEFSGLAPEVGGAFGELARIDEAQHELQNWYDTQLDMLEAFRSERSDLNELWDDQEAALYQEHQERLARIERSRQAAQLAAASNLFGELAGLTKAYAGEQSGIYRAMFAAEKAYSLASILVNSYDAIAKAWASAPFPANLPAVASATASTGALTAAAQVVSIQGMAHDGIDSVPETGTWLLERGERVTTAETSAKLDRTLDEIRSGQGGGEVHVNIINNAPVNIRRGEVYYDGDRRQMDIIIEAVTQAMDEGSLDDAGARNWGVNRASGAR